MHRWILAVLLLATPAAHTQADSAKRALARTTAPALSDGQGRFELRSRLAITSTGNDRGLVLVQSSLVGADPGPQPAAPRFALQGVGSGSGAGSCGNLPDSLFAHGFEN